MLKSPDMIVLKFDFVRMFKTDDNSVSNIRMLSLSL